MYDYESNPEAKGVEYQITEVDPTDSETKGKVYQVYKVSEEVAATMAGKIYRARIIKDPTEPTVIGKVYQVVFIDDPDDPSVKGKVYNAIVVGGSQVVVIGPAVAPLVLPDAIANSLSYVKAFGGTEQRNLPDNYIERQFIYMMDGSYLLTDIVPTYDGKVEMDFQTTTIPSASMYLLGGRTEVYGGLFLAKSAGVMVDAFGTGSGARYTSSVPFSNNTRYKFIFDNKVATLESGGTTLFTNTMTGTTANGASLVINGLNSNGNITGAQAGIYLYSFKAWNAQGELVADYVPAVQKGTVPVVGFYDTVSKTFKTATAGTFAAGGEAVPTPDAPMDIVSNNGVLKARHQSGLPLGYTLLEYVGYSGAAVSLLIDGFDDATSEIHMGWKTDTASVSSNYQSVFAVWTDNQHNSWRMLTYLTAIEKYYVYGNSKSPATVSNVALDTWHDLVCKSGQFIIDNTTYNTTVSSDLTVSTKPMTIGSVQLENYYKYIKIKRQGEWIANFVPAKRKSDGVAGLYDLINNMFIEASTFTAGPEVSDPVEVYTDGTVETINVHGKNLFDKADNAQYIGAYVNSTTGVLTEYNFGYCFCVPCKPNTTYTLSGMTGNSTWGSFTSNSIGTVATAKIVNNGSLTTGANDKYLIGIAYTTTGTPVDYRDALQIEQGSTATDYEPYFDGGTATAEMLLKVGDYKDVQEILSGAITRNVGIKVLDGTENWTRLSPNNVYYISIPEMKPCNPVENGVSTHFVGTSAATASMPDCSVKNTYATDSSGQVGAISIKLNSATTVAQFQQWLADQYAAGTPVIVIYPLATPTTESVTGQTLQVTDGDNVLEITQASLNNLELEAQYNAAVSLTIQEVQDANLDNNVTVTIQ